MTECKHRIRGVIICDQFILHIDPSASDGGQGMAFPLRSGQALAIDRLAQIFGDLIDVLRRIDGHPNVKCRHAP